MAEPYFGKDTDPFVGINHSPTGAIQLAKPEVMIEAENKAAIRLACFANDADDYRQLATALGLLEAVERLK